MDVIVVVQDRRVLVLSCMGYLCLSDRHGNGGGSWCLLGGCIFLGRRCIFGVIEERGRSGKVWCVSVGSEARAVAERVRGH